MTLHNLLSPASHSGISTDGTDPVTLVLHRPHPTRGPGISPAAAVRAELLARALDGPCIAYEHLPMSRKSAEAMAR